MATALREVALAAIYARLGSMLPTIPAERARRAPVDTDEEACPRLILRGESWSADESVELGTTHYGIGFSVTGYVTGPEDLDVEKGLSDLHAQVIAALVGWTPGNAGLGDVSEQDADFRIYDADESAAPAGEFNARFSILAVASTANPYTT